MFFSFRTLRFEGIAPLSLLRLRRERKVSPGLSTYCLGKCPGTQEVSQNFFDDHESKYGFNEYFLGTKIIFSLKKDTKLSISLFERLIFSCSRKD